ncbi:expressed unknown protein [Seminavis robusta]|uniref:Uncharacterized protein n=1 Tax=Seminavis robusta TaxID=568900 RepID=A0A9N8HCP8_9STRA|nr:expressed unknown protein [Seminavis robusta]|eukprot:Sro228_g092500.1 n/a (650) ;mRNA; r:4266-6450
MRMLALQKLLVALFFFFIGVSAQDDTDIIWSSTGGGWRAMFADIGYVNVFQQAGLMTHNSTRFSQVSTVSGGSWFSTQLFFSPEFYNQTVLAETPDDLYDFVVSWMNTYYNISTDVDDATRSQCNTTDLKASENYDPERDVVSVLQDICYLLVQFDFDWALFIQEMMRAASTDFGDPSFVDTIALPENRIEPMQEADLLVQAALVPASRVRPDNYGEVDWTTGVYFGHDNDNDDTASLFTVVLSAAYIVADTGSRFWYGYEDKTSELQTYVAPTPAKHSWSDWEDFYLWQGDPTTGNLEINNTATVKATSKGIFRTPFGGSEETNVIQVASISSAAGGNGSPLSPVVYNQMLSIGVFVIEENSVKTVWRVLAGIAAGVGATIVGYFVVSYVGFNCHLCEKPMSHKMGIGIGIIFGALIGLITGLFYGLGSILIPTIYDNGVGAIYKNSTFDNFAICSQWPNTCAEEDGFLIDGWFIDNPAVVINVGHYQQKIGATESKGKTVKLIITNTNEEWNTTFNYAQYLQYFSTYFNNNIGPGDFLWAPGYWAPFRSPQIFEEYLDQKGLDDLLEPVPNTNFTTALLTGTTIDNPSFGVTAGMSVEILLLNLNENITTFVVGKQAVEKFTDPLANMTRSIAASEVLVQRVRDFVG